MSEYSASFDIRSAFRKALVGKAEKPLSWNNLKPVLTDPSLWLLFISNIVTIYVASIQGWNLLELLWIYWFQSVTIGFYNFLRIISLKGYSTEGLKLNGKQPVAGGDTKRAAAFFFLVHFGFFHFVYLGFLGAFTNMGGIIVGIGEVEGFALPDFNTVLLPAFMFFITHSFSYLYNRPRDTKNQNLGALMFYPYARIIPMHLTIILIPFFASVTFFLGLKVFADAAMHTIEHAILRRNQE